MKFEIEVGGFVTVFRQRKLIVYANSMKEAEEKAKEKWDKLQRVNGEPGSANINYVKYWSEE